MSQQLNLEIETTSEAFVCKASGETFWLVIGWYAPLKHWKVYPTVWTTKLAALEEGRELPSCFSEYRILKVTP